MNKPSQEYLKYITEWLIQDLNLSKIRAITAEWKEDENTACISFYFDGEPSEKDLEDASDICGGIIAHCSNALLEEHYIRKDYPQPLSLHKEEIVYQRQE